MFSTTTAVGLPSTTMPEKFPLWDGPAPIGNGHYADENAFLTVYHPENSNGTCVVICPGGGYWQLAIEPEGHGIARWLNGHGITGLVLEYRLPCGRPLVPLLDAQRAIKMARLKSHLWGYDPKRVGILGFSAGGHLASTAATHYDEGHAEAVNPMDRIGSRPDFAILVYPVISTVGPFAHIGSCRNLFGPNADSALMESFSNERQVTSQTPPVFLAHAQDDTGVPPENSAVFYNALLAHGVPATYLKLPTGGHGLNGYSGPMWEAWQAESLKWLSDMGFTSQDKANADRK